MMRYAFNLYIIYMKFRIHNKPINFFFRLILYQAYREVRESPRSLFSFVVFLVAKLNAALCVKICLKKLLPFFRKKPTTIAFTLKSDVPLRHDGH